MAGIPIRLTVAITTLALLLVLRGDKGSPAPSRPAAAAYPALQARLLSANKAFLASNVELALREYRRGLEEARDSVPYYRALFLTGAGNCEGMLWRNTDAIRSFNEAIRLAQKFHFDDILIKASVGRISIYRQVPGLEAAQQALRETEDILLSTRNAAALTQAANVARDIDFEKALRLYHAAIREGSGRLDNSAMSMIWAQFGHAHLLRRDTAAADAALTEAFRLAVVGRRREMQWFYFYLGWLRRLQGRNTEAMTLLTEARRRSGEPGGIYAYSVERELARVSAAAGDWKAARRYYESTVRLARESRLLTLPGESFRNATEEGLHSVFSEYVAVGMAEYERTGDRRIAARMFSLAEESRSALLRGSLARQQTLPSAYSAKVAEYRRSLTRSLNATNATQHKQLGALRLELANLEVDLGIATEKNSPQIFEKVDSGNALKGIQTKLRDTEVLLSFLVVPSQSFVWAVTRDAFEVHRLPGADVLSEYVRRYRKSLESNGADQEKHGRMISEVLLSSLSEKVQSRRDWILSLDAPLYDLPFAALPAPAGTATLGARHSLRLTLASSETARATKRVGWKFAGIADPVYNRADARNRNSQVGFVPLSSEDAELPRMPGSARELRRCAASWTADDRPELVTGTDAGRDALMREIARSPAVLHLGMHVIRHPLAPGEVMIALGRKRGGEADYLTPLEISTWRYPLGLVTLSGCSSGSGEARPGLGLFGLTRAWLLAGATSVVASHWPIRDDDGQLLAAMYAELSRMGGSTGPLEVARALQRAQSESRQRDGSQAQPSYWAAFFVVGKE